MTGGTTWQAENTYTYEENTSGILAKVKDKAGNIYEFDSIDITYIDKVGPQITIEQGTTTTNQITVEIDAVDSLSGLPNNAQYSYYLKKSTDSEYELKGTATSQSYTFTGLTTGTYNVKVEVQDNVGNLGTGVLNISTQNFDYLEGDITFSSVVWSNSIATVTLTNNTDFATSYQIDTNSSGMNVNGIWTQNSNSTFEIGNLEDGYIIYAKLTDTVNLSEHYATLNITNSSAKTYTPSTLANNTTRSNFDILGVSCANNEIRVQIDGEKSGAKLYNYYYKNINDDDYTLISSSTYWYDTAVITDVTQGTIYQIKATYTDDSGKVYRSQNTATVIALGEANKNQTYTDNRTYIDGSKNIEVSKTAGTGKVTVNNTENVPAGYTITLPEGFKISNTSGENTQSEGAVLIDADSNEYVWIPVNDAVYDNITPMPVSTATASRTYKPMVKQNNDGYYESLIYTFNGTSSYRNTASNIGIGTSGSREPSLITNNNKDGYTWNVENLQGTSYDASSTNYSNVLGFSSASKFGEYLGTSYLNMISSVDNFGGFYVGRYETISSEDGSGNIIVGSRANEVPLSIKDWYHLYLYQDSTKYLSNPYNQTRSITSSMIWQSQYDAMLNYVLTGTDKSKVTSQVGTRKKVPSNSGQDSLDVINNIYDLGSNLYEYTQEANGTTARILRGGSYDTSKTVSPANKLGEVPTTGGEGIGSRLALYTVSTTDTTGPRSTISSLTSTINSITVGVSAVDRESRSCKL